MKCFIHDPIITIDAHFGNLHRIHQITYGIDPVGKHFCQGTSQTS
jgi:hypothetical protein